jgi:hypothetical protein
MMNEITQVPTRRPDFGESFSYASWPTNTRITLTNVRWNSDYRDVMKPTFDIDAWIDQQPGNLNFTNASQKKFQQMYLDIDTPMDDSMQYNYIRVRNPRNPVPGAHRVQTYYYFINDIAYFAGNTTRLFLQLDAWATFIGAFKLGLCYVERSHIGIANTKQMNNYGRDYLSVPEGLDVGGEYRIVKTASQDVMTLDSYSVLVVSAADMTKAPGTEDAPKLVAAQGSVVDGMVSGASFYVFPTPGDYLRFQKQYVDFPWMTEAILSITPIPSVLRYHPGATLKDVAPDVLNAVTVDLPDGGVTVIQQPDFVMYEYPAGPSQTRDTQLAADWRDTLLNRLPDNLAAYRILKKFLTYPYSLVEITTWAGQPLVVQPESWADDDATIREMAVMVPPGQRVSFMPLRYNGDAATSDAGGAEDNAESLDFMTTISNFPSLPIVNNMAIGYLAANKNGLAFQRQTAAWTQTRALMGAQATEDIANADIANTARQAAAGITASGASAQLNMETGNNLGLIGGALGTVGVGADAGTSYGDSGAHSASGMGSSSRLGVGASINPMALAGYDATATIKANAIAQQAAIEQTQRAASAASSITATGAIRDTNVSLARRAAKGDYLNNIAAVNAKVQDAALTQPSIAGQFGGDAMNLAHNKAEVSARWKLLDNAAVKRIGNIWLRYGYAVQQYVDMSKYPDFMFMSKFSYLKLSETYVIEAPIPELFKQTIRGIFEKGVTVWSDPSDIGTTAPTDNQPKDGISY